MSNQYITLGFIILLPIIPAYLLFRALPSTGDVTGTLFKGMEIKLGGSFAGYFAVVLLIFYKHDIWAPPPPPAPPPTSAVWHLVGQVTDASGVPIEPLDVKDFSFSPPTFQAIPGGNFSLTIPAGPKEGGGIKYPILVISHESFLPITVPLEPSELSSDLVSSLGVTREEGGKEIKMQHIVMKAAPPYHSTGPPPEKGPSQ